MTYCLHINQSVHNFFHFYVTVKEKYNPGFHKDTPLKSRTACLKPRYIIRTFEEIKSDCNG